jgi:hypothetical protein
MLKWTNAVALWRKTGIGARPRASEATQSIEGGHGDLFVQRINMPPIKGLSGRGRTRRNLSVLSYAGAK